MVAKKKRKSTKIAIPWSLYMAIVKVQAEEELDFQEACEKASVLLGGKREKFNDELRKEANRLYKKRFMEEQNKAKKKWVDHGKKTGINLAKEEYQIQYPCSKCGKQITLLPEGPSTKAALNFLKSEGWAHATCIK